jgi:cyclopropane-fatty-acyl-phospholipid synthase
MLTRATLRRLLRDGDLAMLGPDGAPLGGSHTTGGEGRGPRVVIQLTDASLLRRQWGRDPSLAFGEAYMDGWLTLAKGTLSDLLGLLAEAAATEPPRHWWRLARPVAQRLHQINSIRFAHRKVAAHYELSEALYRLFLDADLNYSCAYFRQPGVSLEQAQQDKQQLIARKLLLMPPEGQGGTARAARPLRVLDIGFGWGSLALMLARQHPHLRVTGLTLAPEQARAATARAAAEGLSDRVAFHVRDYRAEQGCYDRIVSIGMFEHVGIWHYPAFFRQIRQLLTPDGIALVHAIGRAHGPGTTNPWLRKYIFPGGYAPALSEVLPVIERTHLWVTDIEIWRLHYAHTLRAWQERFQADRDAARALTDERFCRMWELYLAASEMNFRHLGMMVFQIQLAREVGMVPLTREYLSGLTQRE